MLEYAAHQLGGETVLMCENAEFPRRVLSRRYPGVPIVEDVREVDGKEIDAEVLVFGFPCQDISSAGRGEGIGGERSGLWKECFRVLSEMRPSIALIENVDALLRRGLDVVLADLRSIGYHLEWDIIPAAAVGAPHLRQRFFGVARLVELAADPVYGDVLYDRHGERVTFELTGKLPRAGRMGAENVALEPIAPRKTKRHDGWSHWVGVDLLPQVESGSRLFPTATATDAKGSRNETSGRTNPDSKHHSGRTLNDVVRLWPSASASARDYKDTSEGRYGRGQLPEAVREQALLPTPVANDDGKTPEAHMAMKSRLPGGARKTITSLAVLSRNGFEQPESGLWPTPSAVSGEQGPGNSGREGGDNLVTRVARHQRGSLNPTWVNWLLGMPLWWTDPDWPTGLTVPVPFSHEPLHVAPRTAIGVHYRADQLRACGNSVVPQCAMIALDRALKATPL